MSLAIEFYCPGEKAKCLAATVSYILGCANKDLDGYLGPLGKFIEYCRITALLPVIPFGIRDNW